MYQLVYTVLIACFLTLFGCNNTPTTTGTDSPITNGISPEKNPAAPDFNAADSDPQAIEIADAVVKAYGGRKAYDETRYFSWNFFGARELTWDKQENRVRIDLPRGKGTYLVDLDDRSGRAMIDGQEIAHPDSLAQQLDRARSIWINDSYWLVHQFKLKDSGVTLKYVDATDADPQTGRPSYIIDQYFTKVGDTPDNKYRLFVDQETAKINAWQFFRSAADTIPAIETPWNRELVTPRGLILSGDRSGRMQLGNIATPDVVDDRVFTKF